MRTLKILSPRGHDEVAWDPSDSGSVAVAERTFAVYRAKGYAAFGKLAAPVVGPGTDAPVRDFKPGQYEVVKRFDPEAYEEILLSPALQGG
jgi:hypothetical protein